MTAWQARAIARKRGCVVHFQTPMIIAEIQKMGNENALSMLRKFSRRVQGTGLVRRIRNDRYHARPMSKAVKKKRAIKRIAKGQAIKQLIKDGKRAETPIRGQHGGNKPEQATQNNARKE